MAWPALLPVPDHLLFDAVLHRLQEAAGSGSTSDGADALIGGWIYLGLVFDADPLGIVSIEPNQLNIFVAVAFASSPGVFRIVRGLVMDIKTRDYVGRPDARRDAVVHHALGNPAQCARAADRRCLPAHRLHDHPARHARLFRSRPGAGKPRLGHGDQGRQPFLLRSFIHPALPPTSR
jgi:peptide/nickel transport system permease protein